MPECFPRSMGMQFGLERDDLSFKRKFRWLFQIPGVSASDAPGQVKSLPPRRAARPNLSWKEQEFQHLHETIYYPMKPEWKPVQLHLYDIYCEHNPVFDWIRHTEEQMSDLRNPYERGGIYDAELGQFHPIVEAQLKRDATLIMLDGCGNIIEQWTFENCYPQTIEWGELDMDANDIVTVDLTLRYDRAYLTRF